MGVAEHRVQMCVPSDAVYTRILVQYRIVDYVPHYQTTHIIHNGDLAAL